MDGSSFSYLLDKYLTETITSQELEDFHRLMKEPVHQEFLQAHIHASAEEGIFELEEDEECRERIRARLNAARHETKAPAKLIWMRYAAAAAVTAILIAAFFLRKAETPAMTADIPAGSSKAVLTLSDGSVIPLDSAGNRVIGQGIRQQGARLQYDGTGTIAYNTLTTPRGGQFQVRLPDGSNVWLNAASSLRYPTAFTGKERIVEVSGEAYFEIAANAAQAFRVKVEGMGYVEVLGTSFNVNAYKDESSIQTTLLQGAVRVKGLVLQPGQQAEVKGGNVKLVKNADVAQVMAWKRGLFQFNGADLPTVLRQVARWYDVEIVYAGTVPARGFTGEIQRELTLTQVLKILEKNNVRFTLDGRKVTVQP